MSSEHQNQPPDLSIRNVMSGLIFATIGLFGLTLLLLWPIRYVPQDFASSNGAQIMRGPVDDVLYGVPCSSQQRQCSQKEAALLVSDFVSLRSLRVLERAYSRKPFTTLCLFSPGGSVLASIEVAKWLKQKRVELCVAETFLMNDGALIEDLYCYSSCALLFASGRERIAYGAIPVIGVHDIYFQQAIPLTDITFRAESDFLAMAMDYRLTKLDIPYKTLRAFFTPKSSEIVELTIKEMNSLSLLTEHVFRY